MSNNAFFKIGVRQPGTGTLLTRWEISIPNWTTMLLQMVQVCQHCFTIQIGTGSSMEFLFAAFRINRTNTVLSTVEKVSKFIVHPSSDSMQCYASDVDEWTPATLSAKARQKLSALIRLVRWHWSYGQWSWCWLLNGNCKYLDFQCCMSLKIMIK